jgi:hypothetical protein
VFLDWWKGSFYGVANELGALVEKVNGDGVKLQTIANRGVKVYPGGLPDTFTVDHWRCRFVAEAGEGSAVSPAQVISLLQRFNDAGSMLSRRRIFITSTERKATRRRIETSKKRKGARLKRRPFYLPGLLASLWTATNFSLSAAFDKLKFVVRPQKDAKFGLIRQTRI